MRFAEGLGRDCTRALGETIVGVVLHGSLVLGGYVPGGSDIDLLVVVDDPLTDAQLGALVEVMSAQSSRAPGRVDLRVVLRQVAAAPPPSPPMEAYMQVAPGLGSGMQVEYRHPGERDLVVEFSICRMHGRSLSGSAPNELIGEVPNEWVLNVGDAQLADWEAVGDDPDHAQLTVLTACRVWRFADEGCHCSKTEAGEWALERDPMLHAVRDALRQRLVDPETTIDADHVRQLLRVVRARLAKVCARESGRLELEPPSALQEIHAHQRASAEATLRWVRRRSVGIGAREDGDQGVRHGLG